LSFDMFDDELFGSKESLLLVVWLQEVDGK